MFRIIITRIIYCRQHNLGYSISGWSEYSGLSYGPLLEKSLKRAYCISLSMTVVLVKAPEVFRNDPKRIIYND
jgi:hypothetical protein